MKPNNCFVIAGKFCFVLLFFSGLNCGKDNNNTTTTPPIITPPLSTCTNCELLYYGQNQADAPTLDPGLYEATVALRRLNERGN